MRIGFFGGSFNPPTNAHMNIANKALRACNLDKVIFVPMGDTYKKKDLAKSEDRLNMLEIACSSYGNKKIEVSDIEIKENREMCAIDAFRLIDKVYPDDDKFFIMGADNFIKLIDWKESEELIDRYKYIIIQRGEIDLKKYIEANDKLKKCRLQILRNEKYKMGSSSEFRKLLDNENKQRIIQREVYDYIVKNNIYRKK